MADLEKEKVSEPQRRNLRQVGLTLGASYVALRKKRNPAIAWTDRWLSTFAWPA